MGTVEVEREDCASLMFRLVLSPCKYQVGMQARVAGVVLGEQRPTVTRITCMTRFANVVQPRCVPEKRTSRMLVDASTQPAYTNIDDPKTLAAHFFFERLFVATVFLHEAVSAAVNCWGAMPFPVTARALRA